MKDNRKMLESGWEWCKVAGGRKMVEVIVLHRGNFKKDIGGMGNLMGEEELLMRVEKFMKENIRMMSRMDRVKIYGLMENNI
jgi:hypothetical protein